jgi:hypothetical protein
LVLEPVSNVIATPVDARISELEAESDADLIRPVAVIE